MFHQNEGCLRHFPQIFSDRTSAADRTHCNSRHSFQYYKQGQSAAMQSYYFLNSQHQRFTLNSENIPTVYAQPVCTSAQAQSWTMQKVAIYSVFIFFLSLQSESLVQFLCAYHRVWEGGQTTVGDQLVADYTEKLTQICRIYQSDESAR